MRYTTAANLVNELAEAHAEKRLSRSLHRYSRYDLLAIDEFSYLNFDKVGMKLFQIFTEREERKAIAVASNAPFSEWGKTFTDERLGHCRPAHLQRLPHRDRRRLLPPQIRPRTTALTRDAMHDPGTDHTFTDVLVAAEILHATADLIDILGGFLNHADPTIRAKLGAYLIGHHDIDTTQDPALAAAITLAELAEAADLLPHPRRSIKVPKSRLIVFP